MPICLNPSGPVRNSLCESPNIDFHTGVRRKKVLFYLLLSYQEIETLHHPLPHILHHHLTEAESLFGNSST